MASKPKLSWTEKDKGIKCHSKRCDDIAVSNRLCEHHNALWLGQGGLPKMPNYEDGQKGIKEQVDETAKYAVLLRQQMTAAPMQTVQDAEEMRRRMENATGTVEALRNKQQQIAQPLRDEMARLEALVQKSIDAYQNLAGIARERLREFEVREGIAMLESHEVPAQSGVVAKKGASVRPIAQKKAGGRR